MPLVATLRFAGEPRCLAFLPIIGPKHMFQRTSFVLTEFGIVHECYLAGENPEAVC